MPLLVFEFLGTTELMVIALVALIIFGPRKLPEIGRKLGRGMAEFKRASEDFKRTWEYEVEVERRSDAPAEPETRAARGRLADAGGADAHSAEGWEAGGEPEAAAAPDGQPVARSSSPGAPETPAAFEEHGAAHPEREKV